jgi:hypothetical protein
VDVLGRNDPCWCGSGRKSKRCHMLTTQPNEPLRAKSDSVQHPTAPPTSTTPRPPATGYGHPRCYARDLNDCSETLTREHYFSKNILTTMGSGRISGFPWLHGEERTDFHYASLASKVLCDRHNSVLSPLDGEAGRLFEAVGEIDRKLGDDAAPAPSCEYLFNGADLERSLLKALLGMTHADGADRSRVRGERQLVSVLFGQATWHPWWGLHLIGRPTHYFSGLATHALRNGEEIWGIELSVAGLVFQLALGETDRDLAGYHPSGVRFSYRERPGVQTLTFRWPGRPYAQYMDARREGPYGGEDLIYL